MDTQHVINLASPEEAKTEVKKNMAIFKTIRHHLIPLAYDHVIYRKGVGI